MLNRISPPRPFPSNRLFAETGHVLTHPSRIILPLTAIASAERLAREGGTRHL